MKYNVFPFPRLSHISNFNFFYKNTKSRLIIDQNFISNQILFNYRSSSTSTPDSQTYVKGKEISSSIGEATSKILNCQDIDAKGSQSLSGSHMDLPKNVPFTVKPKLAKNSSLMTKGNKNESITKIIGPYIKLTKPNLTVLVTLSAVCTYAIAPYPSSLHQLLFLTVGTTLCSGSANAINMGREPEFDRKMPRTAGRPVVCGQITPNQAYSFAALTGLFGISTLFFGVSPLVAFLGGTNIILYGWTYTSLKRKSILNTWVGAIVGAIPPLMGWAAAASTLFHPGVWCLAGLLYAWQFPHFNSLSHNIAEQYKNAGYVMTSWANPMLNARVALRYSILMFPLCFGLSYYGVTDWVFPIDSSIANGWLCYLAYKFWKQQSHNYSNGYIPNMQDISSANLSAKKLFWVSVWQLPAILILAMLHRKGQWDHITYYIFPGDESNTNEPAALDA